MAARKRKWQTDKTREKIKVAQLINRLNDIALAKVEATPQQVTAIKIALGKILPDLTEKDIFHHKEDVSYEENRAELVGLHGEALTKLFLKEKLVWEDVRELEALVEAERLKMPKVTKVEVQTEEVNVSNG